MSDEKAGPGTSTQNRFVSIDALRGFDMFWIVGGEGLAAALHQVSDHPVLTTVAEQLDHVAWNGFHFYDLIFPLFVFLMGTSTVFSLRRIVADKGKGSAVWRVIRRGLMLYLLGLFYYGALSRDGGPEMFRYVGVLQRIAICYVAGGLLYLTLSTRGLVIACVILLAGYWGLLTFYPVPGYGAGNLDEGKNFTNYVDQHYLPGYKWDGDWDPEGLLSNMPAICSGLLGIFAGLLLSNSELSSNRRMMYLMLLAVGCLAAGWLWGHQFPINKKLWTSSFVLFAGGWSFLLVLLFHVVIDVAKFEIWARPFVWIGMNPITLYMVGNLVNYESVVRRVVHRGVVEWIAPWGELGVALLAAMIPLAIAWFLYRKQIFLRV